MKTEMATDDETQDQGTGTPRRPNRAVVAGGSIEVARRHVKDTLDLSRQLDVEARAVSQLVAAASCRGVSHNAPLLGASVFTQTEQIGLQRFGPCVGGEFEL